MKTIFPFVLVLGLLVGGALSTGGAIANDNHFMLAGVGVWFLTLVATIFWLGRLALDAWHDRQLRKAMRALRDRRWPE